LHLFLVGNLKPFGSKSTPRSYSKGRYHRRLAGIEIGEYYTYYPDKAKAPAFWFIALQAGRWGAIARPVRG